MGLERLIAKRVKLPCMNIGVELSIPCLSIEYSKPLSQPCQLVGREVLDLQLYLFNLTHRPEYSAMVTGG